MKILYGAAEIGRICSYIVSSVGGNEEILNVVAT